MSNDENHEKDEEIEDHWESYVAETFPQCPICGSEQLEFDIEYGSIHDYIFCIKCDSKWEIDWKGKNFKIEYITLLETTDPEKKRLKGEKYPPEFWQRLAQQITEAPPNSKEKEVIRETQIIIKIRCPYCDRPYDEALDACPNCGAKQ